MRCLLLLIAGLSLLHAAGTLPPQIHFQRGAINRVRIGSDTAVYAADASDHAIRQVLLTHARRDAVGPIPKGARVVVPSAERASFGEPDKFWRALENDRFHDYAQQSTKVPVQAIAVSQAVGENDTVRVSGVKVFAIDTPGYTPGSVSYVIETGGKRVICTGDLIYGDGKILDLYSLQDAVPEAKARGYHGYAARAGQLIASLRKDRGTEPGCTPAGPRADDHRSQASISRLISSLQTFLQSHFETDALRWYWGDENHKIRSRAVERAMDVLPMAEQSKLPADILAIGNSRVILSKSGAAFLVDAGI